MEIVFFACFGAVLGSFAYASVLRVARKEGIAVTAQHTAARSHCDNCGATIALYDLIPVVSFVLLRGRCRACHASISIGHWGAELLMSIFGAAVALTQFSYAEKIVLIIYGALLCFTLFYDWMYMRILDAVMIPSILIAGILSVTLFQRTWQECFIGAAIAGGFFLLQYVVSRGKWIGDGDIRLGVLMGMMMGVAGTVVGLFFAYIIGALFAIGLILSGKAKLGSRIPFGTFLSLATLIALLYGQHIWDWYLHLIHYTV